VGGWVERQIVLYGPKSWLGLELILAVFPQTLPSKRALGVLPLIDLALPAFVGPSRTAKVYY